MSAYSDRQPDSESFDWKDDECVVIREQWAVAVYPNGARGITIAQRDVYGDDVIIWIDHTQAQRLARALLACVDGIRARGDFLEDKPVLETVTKSANAQRQQRHRDRKRTTERNAETDDGRNTEALRDSDAVTPKLRAVG